MRRRTIKYIHKKLGKNKIWGQAYIDDFLIEIDQRAEGKKHLEITNHESFHLLFPELEECDIVNKSIILTNLLWKMGYRRVDNTNNTPLQDGKR